MQYVGYARVSTIRQGQSGLGLEAQRAAMVAYVTSMGGELVGEYVEVESGGRNDRPKLELAMRHAQRSGAILLIAKLDRLSRDAYFLMGLQRAGVRFVAADMPGANELVVGIMALLAQEERKLISRRTKEALAARKARGLKCGTPGNITVEGSARGRIASATARTAAAYDFAVNIHAHLRDLGLEGKTLTGIAEGLNREGVRSRTGKTCSWTATSVRNVLLRVGVAG